MILISREIFKAKFIGKDGSMGLKNGTIYDVTLSYYKKGRFSLFTVPTYTVLADFNGWYRVPYEGIETFDLNWERVK